MSDAIVVTTTLAHKEEALSLGKLLLKKRLIGCAQVSSPVHSLYWWKGEIEQSEEYCLVMKSSASLWEMLEEEIRLNHPYDVPEILATPVAAVSKEYEQWLLEELRK
ncbi:MAG: divalent-cation tolerance protein CutA [Proteobacteria bacterium]|nr:divalent-cation tolerance protein CutA [Pseudomonadota bacterium]MBU1138293.1 divalent-cation tolerance protein CutA [Pseudomonadota bacterium]MBU1232235.1 divalent-cation tolerance protein CutA [Pseudomonadota bacterium]MBU1417078.1 divalent-cation tolerance protein CutA [Pseudomonadota bacterium]MBU1453774.1 divalent-cation tolerance protein CutA [Pseudomonadota bacterium]